MTLAQANATAGRKPLRLWPGVAAATLIVLGVLVTALLPEAMTSGLLAVIGGGAAVVVWWLFFSRAPWLERLGALVFMVAAVLAIRPLLHRSISGAGQDRLFYVLSVPVMSLALVAWAAASRRLSTQLRLAGTAVATLLAAGSFALVRTSGVSGTALMNLHWRWTPTPEQRLLAREPAALPAAPQAVATPQPPGPVAGAAAEPATAPDKPPLAARAGSEPAPAPSLPALTQPRVRWPGFRGAERNAVVPDASINTDWAAAPPVELWRRPVGPGWSSFAVASDLLYTQEQRGGEEIVACYRLSNGEPVWRHRDAARFEESNGGPGPRGTPTLGHGRVYTFGATGIVNVLDASTGALVWSKNAATETRTASPYWGFASSPLVVDDVVVVAISGKLVAYDVATGKQRWLVPSRGGSYSSPHLATIDGVPQILLLRGAGVHSVSPADGGLLWEHAWPDVGAFLQPALTADGDVLISGNDEMGGVGTRRIAVRNGPGGWKVEERWTSKHFKPYFSDFVVHAGHAYGFDGRILACIDLADGRRRWKGGRYGNGQLVLLPGQDLLLVSSEEGELALVKATPDQHTEVARFKAIEGKTWNHPVVAGDVLLVRNGEEMAAFRLSPRVADGDRPSSR
jgi:outer membrane protein assembly factor BamB